MTIIDSSLSLESCGYPEPFLKRDMRFSRRWQSLRLEQLVREDIRDLTQIQQLDQLEQLVKLLAERSAHQLIYGNLANDVRVSIDTTRRWIDILVSLHLGFLIRAWFKNVSRSLLKEPKRFLRDWASIKDQGDKAETFVACHLLKAIEGWNDMGLGKFELGYLRDKEKREVDFLVARDGKPWFLAEVKQHDESISPSLKYFQQQLAAPFAFQVVLDANYVDADCFARAGPPIVVPAQTFLSQFLWVLIRFCVGKVGQLQGIAWHREGDSKPQSITCKIRPLKSPVLLRNTRLINLLTAQSITRPYGAPKGRPPYTPVTRDISRKIVTININKIELPPLMYCVRIVTRPINRRHHPFSFPRPEKIKFWTD